MPNTFSLIANSSNQNLNKKNQFIIPFPSGGVSFSNKDTIRLDSMNVIYSWNNITILNNNTNFAYAINGTNFPVNIPVGFYSISDLNFYLQSVMVLNGHYLVDATGNNVYYISLYVNPTYYRVEIELQPIPSTLPSGYTNPANVFYSILTFSNPTTPQIIIPNSGIQQILGMNAGTYPASNSVSTIQIVVSSFCPQVTPVQSLLLRCNLVKNDLTLVNDILFSTSPSNVSFGSNIFTQNLSNTQLSIRDGSYQSIILTLVDQNYNDIELLDPNVVIALSITKH